jgi:hypothetical protein
VSSHRAVFRFRAGAFDLKAEGLGRSWELERDGQRIVLSLPSMPDSFGSHIEAARISLREGDEKESAWEEGRVLVAAVLAFEVAVDVEVQLGSTDLNPNEHMEEIERGQATLNGAFPVALSLAADFMSWLRTHAGRYWLGPSHEAPEVLGGDLLESASGRRVRNITFNPGLHLAGFGPDAGVTVDELDQIAGFLGAEETPGTAEVLLADAREALTGPSVEEDWRSSSRDVRRAILLAAIACEVKIKTVLADKTPRDKRELVDVILKNIREVQVAVGSLPHKTMKAAVGRSLHEDDRALFDAVNRLFKHRNDIAHRGKPPSLDEARTDLNAAVNLFAWLDSLPESQERREARQA